MKSDFQGWPIPPSEGGGVGSCHVSLSFSFPFSPSLSLSKCGGGGISGTASNTERESPLPNSIRDPWKVPSSSSLLRVSCAAVSEVGVTSFHPQFGTEAAGELAREEEIPISILSVCVCVCLIIAPLTLVRKEFPSLPPPPHPSPIL